MGDYKLVAGGTCCAILTLVFIILMSISFSTLEPNEMGLEYNNNNKFVDPNTLWTNGRYALGPGHSFIKFPKNQQQANVQLSARSRKGAEVSLSCAFQWQIVQEKEEVFQLYSLFDDQYAKAFEKIATDELRNVAARFTATDYFFQRPTITAQMAEELATTLRNVGAIVSGFQLLNFDVPAEFSRTVTLTEETKQRTTRARTLQEKAAITAEQKIETAREDARILLLNARAAATAFVQEKNATRDSILTRFTAEANAYQLMKERLNYTNSELLSLIFLSSLEESSAPQTLGVAYPVSVSA